MQESEIRAALASLPLGGLRFFDTIGSTNDEALAWAALGARDLSIVIADEQTSGRGRAGRKWHTPPGAALAMSLILRATPTERTMPARVTGLAALALVQACGKHGLQAEIKWPNDILLRGRKTAGILVESTWAGNELDSSVIGIGVNVAKAAVPPADELSFPATSLEAELGQPLNRLEVLRDILVGIFGWRPRIGSPEFIQEWEQALAYRGETVTIGRENETPLTGKLLGLEPDGSLRLGVDYKPVIIHFGEIHLRPGNDKMG